MLEIAKIREWNVSNPMLRRNRAMTNVFVDLFSNLVVVVVGFNGVPLCAIRNSWIEDYHPVVTPYGAGFDVDVAGVSSRGSH
jgi:hypothetical protein